MKNCVTCNRILPLDCFRSRGGSLSHLKKSKCNECLYTAHKEWSDRNQDKIKSYRCKDKWTLKKRCNRHNVEVSELFEKHEQQNQCCAICKVSMRIEESAIDHNHNTGEFRGLLCKKCNRALGMFKDSPSVLMSAYLYLTERGYYGNFDK